VAVVAASAAAVAFREATRQREALLSGFVAERLALLTDELGDLSADLGDYRKHLEIAARGISTASSLAAEREELDTVITVVRAFELMSIHGADGTERLVMLDEATPPPDRERAFSAGRFAVAREAVRTNVSTMSPPLGDGRAGKYRAIASPVHRRGGRVEALVLLVNLERQLDRLRVGAGDGGAARVHVAEDSGASFSFGAVEETSSPELDRAIRDALAKARAGGSGAVVLPGSRWPGLAAPPQQVVVYAPMRSELAPPWAVAVVVSAAFLSAQESAIILRTFALGGAVVVALVALGWVIVVGARRTVALRERLRAAEEIARHADFSEKVLANVPAGVIVLDETGRIASMNRSARGVVPECALGRGIEAAFPAATPDTVGALVELLARARTSGAVQGRATEPLALAGAGTHFAVFAVPLLHPAPEPRQLLVFEDVTQVRALTLELLRAEKLATVGVLAAGFAHEVGTPLGVMRGRAEMLLGKAAPASAEAGNARIIVDEIDRISRTIRDLLDFSRSAAPAADAAVPLHAVASQVSELLAIEAGRRGVRLEVEIPATLPELAADQDQLKQVLVNLAMNSLDACARGGRILVRARAEERPSVAVIEIEDDGAGIPAEHRHQVFDPFFTTKKRGKGTGLGLAVVARIVRSHGGEIDLDERVSRGTRFVIRWPLNGASGGSGATERGGEPHRSGGRAT
jgi:signal transduction histidine kinase